MIVQNFLHCTIKLFIIIFLYNKKFNLAHDSPVLYQFNAYECFRLSMMHRPNRTNYHPPHSHRFQPKIPKCRCCFQDLSQNCDCLMFLWPVLQIQQVLTHVFRLYTVDRVCIQKDLLPFIMTSNNIHNIPFLLRNKSVTASLTQSAHVHQNPKKIPQQIISWRWSVMITLQQDAEL